MPWHGKRVQQIVDERLDAGAKNSEVNWKSNRSGDPSTGVEIQVAPGERMARLYARPTLTKPSPTRSMRYTMPPRVSKPSTKTNVADPAR